jgi:hypothetical protein
VAVATALASRRDPPATEPYHSDPLVSSCRGDVTSGFVYPRSEYCTKTTTETVQFLAPTLKNSDRFLAPEIGQLFSMS